MVEISPFENPEGFDVPRLGAPSPCPRWKSTSVHPLNTPPAPYFEFWKDPKPFYIIFGFWLGPTHTPSGVEDSRIGSDLVLLAHVLAGCQLVCTHENIPRGTPSDWVEDRPFVYCFWFFRRKILPRDRRWKLPSLRLDAPSPRPRWKSTSVRPLSGDFHPISKFGYFSPFSFVFGKGSLNRLEIGFQVSPTWHS